MAVQIDSVETIKQGFCHCFDTCFMAPVQSDMVRRQRAHSAGGCRPGLALSAQPTMLECSSARSGSLGINEPQPANVIECAHRRRRPLVARQSRSAWR
jgi:hypothetical protein